MSSIKLQMNEFPESIRENLQGAVDFHLHSHEGEGYRSNLVEMAEDVSSAGMSALVIKNLFGTSQEACHIANKHLGRRVLYPSLTLGRTTGGLNPSAVFHFSKADPANRVVEMPVFDSLHEVRLRGLSDDQGVAVFRDSQPVPGLPEILKMVGERNMVLKTGHIAPRESLLLIRLARDAGVEKIVVTHASGSPVMATPEEQKEMADLGALIDIKRYPNWEGIAFGHLDYLKASLESVGPERCIAATDGGQIYNPSPLELVIYLLYLLQELGCPAEETRMMVRDNPRRMLGISGGSENP